MAIRDTDTVDLILSDEVGGAWTLVIAEEGTVPDTPATVEQLARKIDAYTHYVRSGQLVREHPQAAGRPVRIWLAYGEGELPASAAALLKIRNRELNLDGIEVYAERVDSAVDTPGEAAAEAPEIRILNVEDAENEAERAFFTARLTDRIGDAGWILTQMVVWLPLRHDGSELVVLEQGGRAYAAVYTSQRTLVNAMRGESMEYDTVSSVAFTDLARGWEHPDVGIVVNPHTNTVMAMDSNLLAELVRATGSASGGAPSGRG